MGFFGALKNTFSSSKSVQTTLEAPSHVSSADQTLNITVTLQSKAATPLTLQNLTIGLDKQVDGRPLNRPTTQQSVQPIALQPNESKQMPFSIPLKFSAAADEAVQALGVEVPAEVTKVMDMATKLAAFTGNNQEALKHDEEYWLTVEGDVSDGSKVKAVKIIYIRAPGFSIGFGK